MAPYFLNQKRHFFQCFDIFGGETVFGGAVDAQYADGLPVVENGNGDFGFGQLFALIGAGADRGIVIHLCFVGFHRFANETFEEGHSRFGDFIALKGP